MNQTDHLERAKTFIGKGEDFYRKAAEEIMAAREQSPTLGYREIGEALGRHASWCQRLVTHFTSVADPQQPPFGGADENEARYQRHDRRKVAEVAAERPEVVAEAIVKSSPETQRKFADALIKSDNVEASLTDVVDPKPHKPREKKPAWRRLSDYTFGLWEVGQDLMDEAPTGEERVRMISSAEKAQRLAAGIALLLNTGELDDAFRELLDEVETEV